MVARTLGDQMAKAEAAAERHEETVARLQQQLLEAEAARLAAVTAHGEAVAQNGAEAERAAAQRAELDAAQRQLREAEEAVRELKGKNTQVSDQLRTTMVELLGNPHTDRLRHSHTEVNHIGLCCD